MFRLFQLAVSCFVFCFFSNIQAQQKQTPPQRVIILGFDGLSVAGYETAKHPHLDALMSQGALSLKTRAVMPSVTLPNWTSHLTSGGPEQHGVVNNGWRLDNQAFAPIEQDADGYYPSIFKILKDQVPGAQTAYYYNWGNLINSINQKYLDEIHFETDDRYQTNYDMAYNFVEKHQKEPTLVFLYSVHVDHAGHKYGWMSPEYISAIEAIDGSVGTLVKRLKAKGLFKDTYFLLITDHGGVGKGHGGVTPAEMNVPWGIVGPRIVNAPLKSPNSNANTAAVIADIFGCKNLPSSWIGKVPAHLFKN